MSFPARFFTLVAVLWLGGVPLSVNGYWLTAIIHHPFRAASAVHYSLKKVAKKKQPDPNEPEGEKPRVHKDLEGFDIQINSFGEITTSFDMDRVNEFLNKNVDDKKLRDREDIPGRKNRKKKRESEEEE